MHHAAAHRYGIYTRRVASGNGCARKALCDSGVKARRDAGFADSSVHILQQFMPKPRETDDDRLVRLRIPAVKTNFIAVEVVGLVNSHALEFDGGLRFIID